MEIRVTGIQQAMKAMRKLARKYPEAFAGALYAEEFRVWREAVKRAPVDTGILRNSAYAAPPTKRGTDIIGEVGFGTEYAVRQHEATHYRHPRGGEAHYLLKALQANLSGMVDRMATQTRVNVQNGTGVTPLAAPTRPKRSGVRRTTSSARVRRASRRRR